MKNNLLKVSVSGLLIFSSLTLTTPALASNGPNYNGNESIQNERLHDYGEMSEFLQQLDAKSEALEIEVYGKSVKDRDLYLAKFIKNENNPTILYLTQQHGNETLTTEGALRFIKKMTSNSKDVTEVLRNVNILVVPRLNVDGAEGDVNFSLDHYAAGTHTRYNANGVDLNRDHVAKEQPETKAFHEKVIQKYQPDYLIDLHHQGTQTTYGDTEQLVSGSILHPTNENVDPEVLEGSKKLGKVLYDAIEAKGFGLLSKYNGGNATTIGRNGLAVEYGISTLLFEMRGMADHYYEDYVLGQKSNGYLIKQAVIGLEATAKAIADGSIEQADTSFWKDLPRSSYNRSE